MAVVAITLTGCGHGGSGGRVVLRVPSEYRTIQTAVDRAKPGELVLIAPGVYRETVTSHVPNLVIRGLDRNAVILDGGDRLANGITLAANGDAVENLTVRHFAVNGVLFTLLDGYGSGPVLRGYRASYVTAYDNGLYGLYAFAAVNGLFDHDDASGHPDSGIYVGQCRPCDALVQDSSAESNRVGFEAANASGGLSVIRSRFSSNRAGVVVETSSTERLMPQVGAVVAGNVVSTNNNSITPTTSEGSDVFGYGISIGGGSDDQVVRNRVEGNVSVGIIVTDEVGQSPKNNFISGNIVSANHTDLAYIGSGSGSGSGSVPTDGNCFSGNTFATSAPAQIEAVMRCGRSGTVESSFVGHPGPPGVEYMTISAPPPQPGMRAADSATSLPANREPPAANISNVAVPPP